MIRRVLPTWGPSLRLQVEARVDGQLFRRDYEIAYVLLLKEREAVIEHTYQKMEAEMRKDIEHAKSKIPASEAV